MTTGLHESAQVQLRRHVERIERLEEEKRALAADIADELAAAKASGFDPKILRKVLALRRKAKSERDEEQAVLEVYLHALGMLADTPLGNWAQRQALGAAVKGDPEAADRLAAMARADGAEAEPTISIDGGPQFPMSVVKAAVEEVKRSRRGKAEAGAA